MHIACRSSKSIPIRRDTKPRGQKAACDGSIQSLYSKYLLLLLLLTFYKLMYAMRTGYKGTNS